MKTAIIKQSARGYDHILPEEMLYSERKVFFTESVTAESAAQLIQTLLCLEAESESKPITLYINSPGGDVISGLAAYDTIVGLKCPVRTVCIGIAASMGSYLFLAGNERLILPHSQVMIHDPLINGLSGVQKALALEKEANKLMKTREMLGQIMSERTGKSIEEVYEKTKDDTYMSAEEALEFGIATEICDHV
ncbi:MAG: ATP-dependent Clp protease proteolytic subunit [Lachnospiraceae bacterium]|nr:ATP-dependent Clp protease proteolytic subunit [Lachnospiraceae bacterium]